MFLVIVLATGLSLQVSAKSTGWWLPGAQASPLYLPFGVYGDYLTTSLKIAGQPREFRLGLDTRVDRLTVVDIQSSNEMFDKNEYAYKKNWFDRESSPKVANTKIKCSVSTNVCSKQNCTGSLVHSGLTLSKNDFKDNNVQFCDLSVNREDVSAVTDPLRKLMEAPIDGFFPLNPQSNFLEQLGFEDSIVSFFYNVRAPDSSNIGSMRAGKMDLECEAPRMIQNEAKDAWRVTASKISFNWIPFNATTIRFEPSNRPLLVSEEVYDAVIKYFGGSKVKCQQTWFAPDLVFQIQGVNYHISTKVLAKPIVNSDQCQLQIEKVGKDEKDGVVLNFVIMENYCLTLNMGQNTIGLSNVIYG